jgi:hypothetical protein
VQLKQKKKGLPGTLIQNTENGIFLDSVGVS